MNREGEERLMRYLDGECDAAESAEVERWLRVSREARALLSSFERARDVVRELSHEHDAGHSGIVDAVMARLPEAPVAPVVPIARGAARSGRWMAWGPAAGLALAAAASFALHVRQPSIQPTSAVRPSAAPAVPDVPPSAEVAEAEAPGPAEPEPGASIEAVDFGSANGTIFMVSSGSGPEETPVVWMMDDPSPSGRRVKPL